MAYCCRNSLKMTESQENIFLFVPNIIGTFVCCSCNDICYLRNSFWLFTLYFYVPGFGRVILAIISFYFMPTHCILACACYVTSALLDAIDGHAARYFNQSKKEFLWHHLIKLPFYLYKVNCVTIMVMAW